VSTERQLVTTDALGHDLSGSGAGDLAAASLAIARRLARGATLWFAAPSWPRHAQHLADEFANPVIVAKRALPARMVPGDHLWESLRPLARAGDVLLVVSRSDEPSLAGLRQQTKAWGVLAVWIGAGSRPEPGSADYVLWVDDDATFYSHGERLVLLCHLLWESTHVCLEHPSLLEPEQAACKDEVCITCSDEGRLGEVVAIRADGSAQVRTPTGLEMVDMTLVENARPGNLVLIHAGAALTLLEGSPS